MKPVTAAVCLISYGLYRFYKFNEHNNKYIASHADTLAKIEKINEESMELHKYNMRIINQGIKELNNSIK